MITFQKVRWKNLLSTGNNFTEIQLDRFTTTLIVGANGAGKSTILDALSFGLYGKPFRKVNKGQLVNSINGKGTIVEIEFTIGKRQYMTRRGIKPNVFEIFQDGVLLDQTSDVKEYQDLFETQILKLNHKSFSQIVVLGSASFTPFMQLPAAHRREIVEDLLDIEIFSVMNGLLKERIASNRSSTIDIDFNIKNNAEKIELYKKHIDSLKQNHDEQIKQKRDQIVQYTSSITTANQTITELQAEIALLQSSIDDQQKVRTRMEKVRDLARQIDLRLDKLNKEAQFFSSHSDCPTCRQGIGHEHKTEILEKSNTQVVEIQAGKQKILEELDRLNSRLTIITDVLNDISTKAREVSDNQIQIRTWQGFIKGIEREITELTTNTTQIDANAEEIRLLRVKLKELIDKKEELSKDKQTYEVAAALLKDSGIKTKIIKQYIPIINKLINKYLASMDFFVNFEMNETFEETIKSRFRDEFTYDSFSEGEKCRIDLALLFAWRAVAKLRNSASTNLLIMDEVFDSSLDVAGGDELIKIMQGIVSDSNIFVISHRTDQMLDKFEHVIRFEKAKNFSKMVS